MSVSLWSGCASRARALVGTFPEFERGAIRAHGAVIQVDQVDGGEQITLDLRVEINGSDRPGCVAQAIWRHYDLNAHP